MAETHEAGEVRDARSIVEDLGGHAVALALVKASTGAAADDSGRILTTVLEQIQRIVDLYRGRLGFSALLSIR
jgi:hypothetical protein